MLEADKQMVWDRLSGQLAWDVMCRHNFMNGNRYQASARSFRVLASSSSEAQQFVKDNLELVEAYFRSIKVRRGSRSVWAIRRCEKYHMTVRDVMQARPSSLIGGKIHNQRGEIVKYNRPSVKDKIV